MGITYLKVIVANPLNLKKRFERRFLVDSGSVFSVVPENVLKNLGIKPEGTQRFMLANGEEIEKKIGEAKFFFRDKSATSKVVFGDPGVFLLGVTTLENLGMILDPLSREIKPMPMFL
jgi:predicted aspartyl protease|uniref:Aspartyl protease n=1 Tax=candidate division CPR3 bacterium TaxID=2268181 RepID=A0A7C5YXJ0_UNCC3